MKIGGRTSEETAAFIPHPLDFFLASTAEGN